ncbi:MAG: hypothetical protein GY928_32085 [Colwellia sp.]|nr:hypothetical protein [Colwellia sp.]
MMILTNPINFTAILVLRLVISLILIVSSSQSFAQQALSHHVNNIEPSSSITIPKGWPLTDKKLDCISCHSDKAIAEKTADKKTLDKGIGLIDTKADDFLRGGPYVNLQSFCHNCHQTDDYQAPNIHQMLNREGKIKKDNCLYCHDKQPEINDEKRNQLLAMQRAKLRLPKENICFGCHLKAPHLNALEHQVDVDEDMQKHIESIEQSKQISLPLGDKQQVICISCHSPHQRGVLPINSAKGKQVADQDLTRGTHYQAHPWNKIVQRDKRDRLKALSPALEQSFIYQQIQHEVLLRLPAKNGELCLACHTFAQ